MSNNNPSSSGNPNDPLVWQSDDAGNTHEGVRIMFARALFKAVFIRPFADEQNRVQTSGQTPSWEWQPTQGTKATDTPSGPPVLQQRFLTVPNPQFERARTGSVAVIPSGDLPGASGYQPGPPAPGLQPMQLEHSNGQAQTSGSGCSRCASSYGCSSCTPS